jgi:hypothetical protein
VANEVIRIDYAGHTAGLRGIGVARRLVRSHYPASALDNYRFSGAGDFWRQGNFKFDWRANLQGGIGANVNTRGTQVPGDPGVLAGFIRPMNLDR